MSIVRILIVSFALIASSAAQQRPPLPAADDADQPIKTSVQNPDAVAVVIGVAQYQDKDIPPAAYAANDADGIARVLTQTFGYSPQRVFELKNDQASGARLKAAIRQRLAALVQSGKSDIFFYFSGHGEPNVQMKEAYLIPWDFDSQDEPTADTAYAVKDLYADLAKLNARSVTVILEACFTGQSKSGPLIKAARPLRIDVDNPAQALSNGLVITASGASEIASDHPERPHGLLTYYWLRAMRGEAADNQGRITPDTLKQYLQQNVSSTARTIQRTQMPEVVAVQPTMELARLPVSALRTGDATVVRRTGALDIFIDLGGELSLDGILQGNIEPGGTFIAKAIAAGVHRIEIRKQGYDVKQDDVVVIPDETTRKTYLFTANSAPSPPRPAAAVAVPVGPDRTTPVAPLPVVAAPKPNDATGMYVRMPAGGFRMGCSDDGSGCPADQRPAHQVRISKPFEIGKTRVTQAEWQSVMGSNPSQVKGDDRAVDTVSWNDVQEFLRKLNARQDGYRYRLPTEAEWEYAAGSIEELNQPAKKTDAPVAQTSTVLWFYRVGSSLKDPIIGGNPTIYVDGQPTGKLDKGEFFGYAVTPGTHSFNFVKSGRGAESVTVAAGGRAFIEFKYVIRLMGGGGPKIGTVDDASGVMQIKGLRPAESKTAKLITDLSLIDSSQAPAAAFQEWTQDWYAADYYKSSPASDPGGPANGKLKVVRIIVRPSAFSRGYSEASERSANTGFRYVREQNK